MFGHGKYDNKFDLYKKKLIDTHALTFPYKTRLTVNHSKFIQSNFCGIITFYLSFIFKKPFVVINKQEIDTDVNIFSKSKYIYYWHFGHVWVT